MTCNKGLYIFAQTQKSTQEVLGHVCCPNCKSENCGYISFDQNSEDCFDECRKKKTSCQLLYNPSKERKCTKTTVVTIWTKQFRNVLQNLK